MALGAPTACADCGRDVVQVITPPALYAIGERGAQTRDTDQREQALARDLTAYKRLRHQGYQPQGIDGADRLATTAQSAMEINSGGIVKGDESQIHSAMELAREITAGQI